jgi:hypothetical protein
VTFGLTLEGCNFHPIVSVMTNLVTFCNSTLEGFVNVYRFIANRTTLTMLLTVLVTGRTQAQFPDAKAPVASAGRESDSPSFSPAPVTVRDYSSDTESLKADCGADQSATAGNWVTLSGKRSTPAGRIGYRWIQLSGPRPKNINEEAERLMFLPTTEGTYEFALVVAAGNRISVPDFVTVAVAGARTSDSVEPPQPTQLCLDRVASQCASRLEDPVAAARLAQAFAQVATRMELYETYEDVLQGITTCLVPVLPTEPDRRALWEERLFAPLTKALIREIQPTGLDLSRPEGIAQPMSSLQKKSMSESYRLIAKGLFSSGTPSERKPTAVPLTTSKLDRERSSR